MEFWIARDIEWCVISKKPIVWLNKNFISPVQNHNDYDSINPAQIDFDLAPGECKKFKLVEAD